MGEQFSLGIAHYFACVYRPHHLTLMIPQISLQYSTVDGFYHASTLPIVNFFSQFKESNLY